MLHNLPGVIADTVILQLTEVEITSSEDSFTFNVLLMNLFDDTHEVKHI